MTRWLLQEASIFALFALGAAACSSGPQGSDEDRFEQPIVGGALDMGHTNVFGLVVEEGVIAHSCTATLLAPNLLLTARHCVTKDVEREVICGQSGFGDAYPPEDLYVTNAPQFHGGARWFKGKEIHVPEEGDDTCGFDVAMVVLAANVPGAVAKPAVPRIDQAVVEGEAYVAVGYGVSDDGHSGNRMMRAGLSVGCDPGSCGLGVRSSEFVGETGICEGDSGGPALDEAGKVVGVVSRGAEDCTSPVYAGVSAWRAFISGVATHAATLGGYEEPFWVKTGSSDPPPEPDLPPAPKPGLGNACSLPSDCAAGLACQPPSGNGVGRCVALCSSKDECPVGLRCGSVGDSAVLACVEAIPLQARETEKLKSSCAFGRAPSDGSLPLVALLTSSFFALRRKRRMTLGSVERSQK